MRLSPKDGALIFWVGGVAILVYAGVDPFETDWTWRSANIFLGVYWLFKGVTLWRR